MEKTPIFLRGIIIITTLLAANSCTTITPEDAANQTCDCLHETVRIWEHDEKANALLKFGECGQMQEDYKKQFSGNDLYQFNKSYDKCLEETISSEMLMLFFK